MQDARSTISGIISLASYLVENKVHLRNEDIRYNIMGYL
jgi:hypothetical protein